MSSHYFNLSHELYSHISTAFRVENSFGQGFNLLWDGPNATNVPIEAVIVDDSSPDIIFSNLSQWGSADNVQYYKQSLAFTTDCRCIVEIFL
jgi:hypothetical protein